MKAKDERKKPEWTIKKIGAKRKKPLKKQIKTNERKTKEHPRKPMKKTPISKEQHMEIIPSPIRTPRQILKLHKELLFLEKNELLLVTSRKKNLLLLWIWDFFGTKHRVCAQKQNLE